MKAFIISLILLGTTTASLATTNDGMSMNMDSMTMDEQGMIMNANSDRLPRD